MNHRPMFIFANGERAGNGEVYATEPEAMNSALARYRVWTMPVDYDTDETDAPVTYRWDTEKGERVNISASELYDKAGKILGKS